MKAHITISLVGLLVVSGCTSFRGIPSHGGGKRFDEEQRLIAASIYKALEQMQCEELRGKKVRVVHEFTTTYGSGNANFGGLQDLTLLPTYSFSDSDYDGVQYNWRTREMRDTYSWSNVRYRPNMTFYTSNANTDRDAAFFRSCLEMKLRHEGVIVVPKGEDVTVYVLLDVLGTNRSRKDRIIQITEMLNASCEFTYYAVDVKTGKLLSSYRRNGGVASYKESTVLFLGYDKISRNIESSIPLEMPIFALQNISKKTTPNAAEKPMAKPATKPQEKAAPKPVQKPVEKKQAPNPQQKPAPATASKPAPESAESKSQTSPAAKKAEPSKEQREKELQELRDQARLQVEAGRRKEAKETFDRINSIDPNADEAKETEQLLKKEKIIK